MAERAGSMKYGISQQLDARRADLAQRFHAALLRRMHEVQLGARPSIGNPLDCAIKVMEEWGKAVDAGCAAHGLAHPCEACAAELPLREALQQIADMDPESQRADDLGRAARIARDALTDGELADCGLLSELDEVAPGVEGKS